MIRRADERDVPEIARIINAAFEVEREFREGARTSPTEIAKLLEHDVFFVAEEDGRLLGAVHTSIDGATGYFGMLSVDPALQRRGVVVDRPEVDRAGHEHGLRRVEPPWIVRHFGTSSVRVGGLCVSVCSMCSR